jgi:hypothetical protein
MVMAGRRSSMDDHLTRGPVPRHHRATDRSAGGLPRRRMLTQHTHRRRWVCAGHVDLGNLGLADRWADLAIATKNVHANYSTGYEDELLHAYGIDRDNERISYYRRLWDAT